MARRPAVRHGSPTAAYDDAEGPGDVRDSHAGYAPVDPWDPPVDADRRGRMRRRSRRGHWSGAGGRWWVWIGRAILWAFILVVLVNGIRAPFERFTADRGAAPAAPKKDEKVQFPTGAASAYALQFADVYLNYDQKNPAARQQQLQYFTPDGADGQFGWNGAGQMQLQAVHVAGIEVRDANNGVVALLAKANGRWLQLAVPVYAKDGAMVISGRPALLPPPVKATLPDASGSQRDSAVEAELQEPLIGFFKAYASGDSAALSRFSDRDTVASLSGSVTFSRLREVIAPDGEPDMRDVTATVVWRIPSGQPKAAAGELEQTYQVTVVKKDGKWYVRDIRGSTEPSGS